MPSIKGKNARPKTRGQLIPFPSDIQPMLATLVNAPVEEPGWMYEVKWDGYRALAYLNKGTVEIKSRNNKSFNEKFYPIYQDLQVWNVDAVVDGEIAVMNDKGLPDFGDLQNWRSEADGQLVYYIFDLLWFDGIDYMTLPLQQRREKLRSIMPANSSIRLSETFDANGKDFFALADKMGLEGIMAKRANSLYTPNLRTKDWLKIKTEKRQEMVIGGYTKNEGTNKLFSALLVGWFRQNEFVFVTPVGTGFSNKLQAEILAVLQSYIVPDCPAKVLPDYNKPSRFRPNPPKASVTWVKPVIVCEVSYREMTKDGAIRHPSFKGLRSDKAAKEVVEETPTPVSDVLGTTHTLVQKKVMTPPTKNERRTLLNPAEETQVKTVAGNEMKFTNLGKIYWPKDQVTKRDMINYYYQVAPYILPFVKDRPQTLNRFPHGIDGETFYQKDIKGKAPAFIKTFPYHSYTDNRDKEFLVITDEASLLYVASLGCIEINPWSSKTVTPDHPDWCIIDLDPDKNTFEQVIETACITKQILDAIDVSAYCKTSGSTGLHIYIPLGAKYSYEESKEFGRVLAKLIHGQVPDYTSIERKIADRDGKMYIDFLQNRPGATVAGPYSLRPKPGAPVSMPLHWDEVKPGLAIKNFTIANAISKARNDGDIFKPVLGAGINMKGALKKIETLFVS